MSAPRFPVSRRAAAPSRALRRRRRVAGAAALTVALGLASPVLGIVATPATALTEYREIHRFEPEGSDRAGNESDVAGDYVAYVSQIHKTISFSHLSDAAAGTWDTVSISLDEAANAFGSSIVLAADASRAYVSNPTTESVLVYVREGANTWGLERTLAPEGFPDRVSAYNGTFGESLALDGDRLLVGAPNSTVDRKRNAGLAFLVDLSTDTWTPLIPENPLDNSITGQAVAISGDRVALGAVQTREPNRARLGGVYLWDIATMAEPLFTKQPLADPKVCHGTGGGSGPAFGISLAFDQTSLYVGSPLEVNYTGDDPEDELTGCKTSAVLAGNTSQGAVYRFDNELRQLGGKIIPPAHSYRFGGSLAASENALLVNAQQPPTDEGEVHVYDTREIEASGPGDELSRQHPAPAQSLVASNPAPGAQFGSQVYGKGISADATRAVIGAPRAHEGLGAVYLFAPLIPNVETELTGADATVAYGERTSILASVTGDGSLDGTVSATVAGISLVPVATAAGSAELQSPADRLDVGDYSVDLAFTPAGEAVPVATATATLAVTPQSTVTTVEVIDPKPPSDAAGVVAPKTPIRVGGTVSDAANTEPSGSVEILIGEEVITALTIDAAGAFEMDSASAGIVVDADTTVEARYGGDLNHLSSAGTTEVTVTVDPVIPPPVTPPVNPTVTPPPGGGSEAPGSPLASTGAGALTAWLIAALAALLLAGGVWVLTASRRRARPEALDFSDDEDAGEDESSF